MFYCPNHNSTMIFMIHDYWGGPPHWSIGLFILLSKPQLNHDFYDTWLLGWTTTLVYWSICLLSKPQPQPQNNLTQFKDPLGTSPASLSVRYLPILIGQLVYLSIIGLLVYYWSISLLVYDWSISAAPISRYLPFINILPRVQICGRIFPRTSCFLETKISKIFGTIARLSCPDDFICCV